MECGYIACCIILLCKLLRSFWLLLFIVYAPYHSHVPTACIAYTLYVLKLVNLLMYMCCTSIPEVIENVCLFVLTSALPWRRLSWRYVSQNLFLLVAKCSHVNLSHLCRYSDIPQSNGARFCCKEGNGRVKLRLIEFQQLRGWTVEIQHLMPCCIPIYLFDLWPVGLITVLVGRKLCCVIN